MSPPSSSPKSSSWICNPSTKVRLTLDYGSLWPNERTRKKMATTKGLCVPPLHPTSPPPSPQPPLHPPHPPATPHPPPATRHPRRGAEVALRSVSSRRSASCSWALSASASRTACSSREASARIRCGAWGGGEEANDPASAGGGGWGEGVGGGVLGKRPVGFGCAFFSDAGEVCLDGLFGACFWKMCVWFDCFCSCLLFREKDNRVAFSVLFG